MKITSCKNAATLNARNASPCNPPPMQAPAPGEGMDLQYRHPRSCPRCGRFIWAMFPLTNWSV